MNPFVLLLLAAGGTIGLSRLVQAVEKQRKRKAKRKLKPRGNPLCGAYWIYGMAIQPFQTKGGWTFAIYDSAGREDGYIKEVVNEGGQRYATKTAALEGATIYIAEQSGRIQQEFEGGGIFYDPNFHWEEPVPPHIRVFSIIDPDVSFDLPVQMPPEVDKHFCTNPDTNEYWVSDNCDLIVEGAGFEPYSQGETFIGSEEAPTLDEVLAIQGNSVYGYIATLFSQTDNAHELAKLVRDAMPYNACLATPLTDRYIEDLARRISTWVVEEGGIPFNPE